MLFSFFIFYFLLPKETVVFLCQNLIVLLLICVDESHCERTNEFIYIELLAMILLDYDDEVRFAGKPAKSTWS